MQQWYLYLSGRVQRWSLRRLPTRMCSQHWLPHQSGMCPQQVYRSLYQHLWTECYLQCFQSHTNVQLPTWYQWQRFRDLFPDARYLIFHKDILIVASCNTGNFLIDVLVEVSPETPCNPSPCGPNSQCRNVNGQAVCSCVPGYVGSPPSCRPECTVSSDCPRNEACSNLKCVNPCIGSCGIRAQCQVINHNPICSCPAGLSGDPFVRCDPISKNIPLL